MLTHRAQVGADSGHSKVAKGRELKTQLIDEAGLFAIITASAPHAAAARAAAAAVVQPAAAPAPPPAMEVRQRDPGGPSGVHPSRNGALLCATLAA